MTSKRQQTMAKREREQKVKERRAGKQQKRFAARQAPVTEGDATVVSAEKEPGDEARTSPQ